MVHITNSTTVSRYDFIRELLRAAGLAERVESVRVADAKWTAQRPRYSALSDASLRRYGIRVRDWRHALPDYLALRRQMRLAAAGPGS